MKKLIFIFILFCSTVIHAQSPFDSFDTTMKTVPLYKSKNPQVFILYVADPNSSISYIQVNADEKTLDYFDRKDSLVASAIIRNHQVKFLSVDPLTKKYPELTPYQFASNTPIQAIDLDGLEAYIIPGTRQTENGAQFSQPLINELKRIGNNTQSDATFRWNAPLMNSQSDRRSAAEKLVDHIWDVRATMIKNGKITDKEPITLVGYSHGGNVGVQAAGILKEKYDTRVNLITISTPAYNDKNSPENPAGNSNINQHYQFVHENDRVTNFWARGSQTYSNGNSINYVITDKDIKIKGSVTDVGPHFLPYAPNDTKFVDYLKKIPVMSTPPGNTGFMDDFIKAR